MSKVPVQEFGEHGARNHEPYALDESDVFPLSHAQERLWFLTQVDPESAFYHIPVAFSVRGPLFFDRVAATLSFLIDRHETLRTTFRMVEGGPVQIIAPEAGPEIRKIDVRHLSPDQRDSHIAGLVAEEAARPFDLSARPPWRTTLIAIEPEYHVFVFTMHHIISDG